MATVQIPWNPYDPLDPGPCIDVQVMNSPDVIKAGRAVGLEYPPPLSLRALLDTGASITLISKQFANYCKLRQTNEGSEISAIGAIHRCGEHAGSISFPDTGLRGFDSIRIISAVFAKERYYSCLIGRDILRNWIITFDGGARLVTIKERD
jgi:predicted aspartyl protease